ncbi:MAG TPA: shikimate kinase [Candidatus Binatia bacterium]|nr:shikimate kinase [Candidatus Binatia bacterium]
MNNVFLTGFMATGKTLVGRAVAKRLGRHFVDADVEIEREAGMSIADIFGRFGEGEFRARERRTLERLCGLEKAVIATGGGAVVDPRNRAAMRASGTLVCLTADPAAILHRVGNGGERPLLADANGREARIRSLLGERAAAYGDADLIVDTSRRSAEEVAGVIVEWLADPRVVPAGSSSG